MWREKLANEAKARIFWGEQLLPTSAPLPTYAYPLLVATFVGWIWTLWREGDSK